MVDIFGPQTNDPIDADLIAELVRRSRRTVSGSGVIETPDGWFIRRLIQEAGGGIASQTVLLARNAGEFSDHLECRSVDSDPEEYTPIFVAKPWLLRKTPWDGQIRGQVRYVYDLGDSTKRTAFDSTSASLKRDEQIHARYLIGDVVNAIAAVTGVELDTSEVDDDGLPIIIIVALLDLNVDSREWKTYYQWL
jgi:hypothetical protein